MSQPLLPPHPAPDAPPVLVMGSPGHVEGATVAERLSAAGDNTGNLVFQHAVTRLLEGPLVHLAGPAAPWGDGALHARARALVFPAANHLRSGADWTALAAYLARPGPPLVLLGLGAQARAGADVAATVAALRADPAVTALVAALRARGARIAVRGAFSGAVADGLGLAGAVPLGCPSILLNPAPDLGRRIAAALSALRARAAGKGPLVRPVMGAAAPFEIRGDPARMALEQRLFSWTILDRDGLYVQQSGGVAAAMAASGAADRIAPEARASLAAVLAPDAPPADLWARLGRAGRFPVSAPDWIAELAARDLAIGSRVHGVLAALAAGIPGILVPHDARTAELARTHALPVLTMEAACAAPSFGAALAQVRFDAAAFDHARRETAAGMVAFLGAAGLAPSAHLRALAGRAPALAA